jgi:NAD(P)-dependent dehydrogenase (short-subunit alcohol dehydrogenase family)
MKSLEKKTAFITGGNSGIGKASAIAVAKQGANVMIADLKSNPDVIKELQNLGIKADFIACDVSSPMAVKEAVEATVKVFGSLDIAFNNAGIGDTGLTHEKTVEAWQKVININLNGVFYCMKYQIAQMLTQKNGGAIVNTSSILGKVGTPDASAYCAAKHGVIGLTQAAALEYATKNIRINALCPGYIDTPLLGDIDPKTLSELKEKHAMKRLGRADEVAKAFLWLASDDSSFLTGDSLAVDGGYLAQ